MSDSRIFEEMRLLIFALLVGCACANSVSYTITDVSLPAGIQFSFALFNITLDFNPYVNSTPVSQLSLATSEIGGRESVVAIVEQLNMASLVCPCSTIECSGYSVCNGTTCLFQANATLVTATEGPPNILIPLPAIQDTLYLVFTVFSGRNASTLGLSGFSNTLLYGLSIRNYDNTDGNMGSVRPADAEPIFVRVQSVWKRIPDLLRQLQRAAIRTATDWWKQCTFDEGVQLH